MKRQLFFGTLCAAALSVGLSAQSGSSPTGQTPSSAAQQPSRAKQDVTLTGCLQTGSGSSTTGTSGTAASGSEKKSGSGSMSGGEFILANAKIGGSSGSSATGTAGSPTGAASSSSSAADKYKLVGHENDLRKYANSQIEVRGTIESKASSTSGADAPSASASSSSSEPTVRVSSVKQISPSCSGGN